MPAALVDPKTFEITSFTGVSNSKFTGASCVADMLSGPPNRIKELRSAHGWSMAQLGARCVPPVSSSQINKLEKGGTNISPKWMRILSGALECNPLEILPGDLRNAVLNFRRALEAAEPPDAGPPGANGGDHPTTEEWDIIQQYRAAAETTRQIVRAALAAHEPPRSGSSAEVAIFEFKAEHDGTYRLKAFWPPDTIAKSKP